MAGFIDSLDSWLGSDWKQRKTLKKLSRAYECRCGTHVFFPNSQCLKC